MREKYSLLKRLREKCSEDLLSMALLLGFDVTDVHRRMAESTERNRSLVLAPRGFGKSTILSVSRCVFEIVRSPDIRILLASNTHAQAQTFLREIRTHFERNRPFRAVFGNLSGTKWSDRELIVRSRRRIAKEPTIFATGVGGAVISRHFDLILCDDIVDEENSRTELQREKLRTWFFKVLLPCLEPEGSLGVVGTRYHYCDLYGYLIESGFFPVTTVIPALDPAGRSAWPEKFPAAKLEQIRREAGTVIFNAQYQNNTDAMKGVVFREEWIRYYDIVPESLWIYQGVDLAIACEAGSDYFAVVTIGLDVFNNIYVIDCHQARLSFRQQTGAIIERFRRFDPVKLGIESNAYQAAQADTLRELGIPRVEKVFTSKDKLSRGWKLSARFEDGRVWLGRNMHELAEQLLLFPQGDHDDLFDALDLAVTVSSSHIPRMRFF